MTTDDTRPAPMVRLRSDGAVDEETLAYARTKVDAVVDRPGLPAVTGEVRIVRAPAHHSDSPWSATADLHVGGRQVVAVAEEATGPEVVDRLQDRLRRQTDKAAQSWGDGHRTTAPPWRGGGSGGPVPPRAPTARQRTPARREPAVSTGPVGDGPRIGPSACSPPAGGHRQAGFEDRPGQRDDQRPTDGTPEGR
ncbi:hypothetical protein [Streptomyces sp. NPDC048392]|uniref:hypothetical protein n=1 Tax=Streptomyces sp. NPDC048392 TaxID=3365543 RepID=UPI003720C8A4